MDRQALNAGLKQCWPLPPEFYGDPHRHRRELNQIFRQEWQYAGPLDQVREAGSYMTTVVAEVPLVVTRALDGVLRGFVNVCRHRSAVVADGCGRSRSLVCPYHAWTYSLDGSLLAAPRSDREVGFDPTDYPLRPVQIDAWGPLVFVNLDQEAPALADWLGDIPDMYAKTGLRIDDLAHRDRREYTLDINWKTYAENIVECYHCPSVHPAFAGVFDLDDYELEGRERSFIQRTRPRERPSTAAADAYDFAGGVEDGLYVFVWPNFMANVSPGIGHFHTNSIQPLGPDRMVIMNDFFFVPEVSTEDADSYVGFQHQVSLEDIAPLEAVARGLGSRAGLPGRLMQASEPLTQHFMQTYVEVMES